MTHRQFVTWGEWFAIDFDRPSRTDWYLIRVAAEAFYSNRRHPGAAMDLDLFRIRRKRASPPAQSAAHAANVAAVAKFRLARMLGPNARIEETTPAGDDNGHDG
jgi:hypothetical protein